MVPFGVAAVLLAGCAQSPDVVQGPQTPVGSASPSPKPKAVDELVAALEKWKDFPANADPRPLLILRHVLGGGWKTGEAKDAFERGNWKTPAQVAKGPDRFGGYPVIHAYKALKILRDEDSEGRTGSDILTIEKMSMVTVPDVQTDRGPKALPAWRFDFVHASQPLFVVAVDESAQYTPAQPMTFYGGNAVRGDESDTELTLRFGGSPDDPGPCGADYQIEVAESGTAVAYRVFKVERPAPESKAQSAICDGGLATREAPLTLGKPLGGRVIVSAFDGRTELAVLIAADSAKDRVRARGSGRRRFGARVGPCPHTRRSSPRSTTRSWPPASWAGCGSSGARCSRMRAGRLSRSGPAPG